MAKIAVQHPSARPMRAELLYRPRRRFSALTRRILFFNTIAFFILIAGVTWVQSNRIGLVEERIAGIHDQALIVAGALAEYTTELNRRSIDTTQAEPLLRQLIGPTHLRARVYSTVGRLQIDTRNLLARNLVTTAVLPSPETNPFFRFLNRSVAAVERVYDGLMGVRPLTPLEPYFEAGQIGTVYREVNLALSGESASGVRVSEQDKLVLSVAVPITRPFGTLYGVLLLTTESGDIDDILKAERQALVQVFAVAFVALLFSSLYLAGFIAAPILKLAGAAERVRRGRAGRDAIPTLDERGDEIGELADSLSAMTRALYDRIDAIESFAADVAHELKNPLTSLKSGIDMLERTKDREKRDRLVQVVHNDINRINRLITDISDASRLDAELSRGHSEPVNISKLLDTIVDIYSGLNMPRGIRVRFSEESPKAAIVQGLSDRLGQVFRNLIDNAISFSPDNGTVLVRAEGKGDLVRANVEDDGPGIAEDDLERIFQRFYTERPPEHGFGKNSGLGLAIARQIIASHGGRIWAENKHDANGARLGARFIVELPLTRNES